jgi:hypothetical protein
MQQRPSDELGVLFLQRSLNDSYGINFGQKLPFTDPTIAGVRIHFFQPLIDSDHLTRARL